MMTGRPGNRVIYTRRGGGGDWGNGQVDRQTRIGERIFIIIIIVEAKNERRQSEKEERTSTSLVVYVSSGGE